MYYGTVDGADIIQVEFYTASFLGFISPKPQCKSLGWPAVLKMDRYYSTTMCHYWDMSVK